MSYDHMSMQTNNITECFQFHNGYH